MQREPRRWSKSIRKNASSAAHARIFVRIWPYGCVRQKTAYSSQKTESEYRRQKTGVRIQKTEDRNQRSALRYKPQLLRAESYAWVPASAGTTVRLRGTCYNILNSLMKLHEFHSRSNRSFFGSAAGLTPDSWLLKSGSSFDVGRWMFDVQSIISLERRKPWAIYSMCVKRLYMAPS